MPRSASRVASVAHLHLRLKPVFANLKRLSEPDFPLEGYSDLEGTDLVEALHGTVADLQGYVAYKRRSKQLVVAFSGTRTPSQAALDCHFAQREHPVDPQCRVHRGFWRLYQGIAQQALAGIQKAFAIGLDVAELVITGHSMGGAVSYLLAIDLLTEPFLDILPRGMAFKLAVFGAPRVGDNNLSELWNVLIGCYRAQYGEQAFVEYSVKAYNDGRLALLLLPKQSH